MAFSEFNIASQMQQFQQAHQDAMRNSTASRNKSALTAGLAGNGANSDQVQLQSDQCTDMMFVRESVGGGAQMGGIILNDSSLSFKSDAPVKMRNTDPSSFSHRQLDSTYLPKTKLTTDGDGHIVEVAATGADKWYKIKR